MGVKIKFFQYYSSAPAMSMLARLAGYRIAGSGFGDKPGRCSSSKPVNSLNR